MQAAGKKRPGNSAPKSKRSGQKSAVCAPVPAKKKRVKRKSVKTLAAKTRMGEKPTASSKRLARDSEKAGKKGKTRKSARSGKAQTTASNPQVNADQQAGQTRPSQEAGDLPGQWAAMMSGFFANPGMAATPGMPGPTGLSEASATRLFGGGDGLAFDQQKLSGLQAEYAKRMLGLLSQPADQVKPSDRRFSGSGWQHGLFGWNAAMYELNAEFLSRMGAAVTGNERDVQRVRFAISQWVDAMSPANFLVTNPQAQQVMLDTQGRSLQAGMQNLMEDIYRGRISQTDETAFRVGENLAVTPGSVVYENELIQLIQYQPTTSKVGAVPMLMVPPCINKFYILDLQPSNSIVAWLVDQGHTVFMLSWKNVWEDQGSLTWDDYLDRGAITAINTVKKIAGVPKINALGFCVGGTIVATALSVLAARGEQPVQSLTLLTTLLDFENAGVLNIFVDEAHVAWREATIGQGGLMAGSELAQTFSSLRPNDLIWNYVERNYLQGEKPAAFDLLFWNADSTNLPGPMFAWYLRHMYLQNDLCVPDTLECLGEKIDLSRLTMPTFIYGSRDDHIVPWDAAYASRALLGGPTEFVMGASGHIAGVINHPDKNKRHHWVNNRDVPDVNDWLTTAEQRPGSWWPHWAEWLLAHRGKMVAAPATPGSAEFQVIEAAPGRYVKQAANKS